MKVFKILLILVTAFIAAIVIGGFLVPGEWRAEAKANIKANPAQVAATVRDLSTWPQWTAWNERDYPNFKRDFSDVTTGVGAYMTWDDGAMVGKVEIKELSTERMDYFVYMDQKESGDWAYEMACYFDTKAADNGTEAVWGCWGNSGSNPITRLMMAIYQPMMRDDFAKGLANLQAKFGE